MYISDGWTTDDLQYLWKTLEPVQIVRNLHLPRFTLEKYISDYCNIETNTGKNRLPYEGNYFNDAIFLDDLFWESLPISSFFGGEKKASLEEWLGEVRVGGALIKFPPPLHSGWTLLLSWPNLVATQAMCLPPPPPPPPPPTQFRTIEFGGKIPSHVPLANLE